MRKDWLWAPEESTGATAPTQDRNHKGQVLPLLYGIDSSPAPKGWQG